MNNRKSLFLCVLAGIMSCTYSMTASAGSFVNGGQLKNGLLLKEKDNGNYHIADYNTNDDNVVNVLDLCRVKAGAFTKNQPEKQNIYIKCSGPWISDDKSQITVPVHISGNFLGVSAVSFRVAYNSLFFTMTDAYSSQNAKVSFSKDSDQVQYAAPGGRNLSTEGYFIYLVFDVASEVPAGKYDIELNDIQAAMNLGNGKVGEISKEECNIDDRLVFDFSREAAVTTTVTEPVITAPVTTAVTTVPVTTAPVTTVTKAETKPEPPKNDELSFYMDNAVLSGDGRQLKIPVYMTGNKEGICNLNTVVKFDRNKFSLIGVERGEYEGYGYVTGNGDNAVFNTNNNVNITAQSGVIAYYNFEVKGGADQNSYRFELSDIKAAKAENWNQKNIDKCRKNSEAYEYKFDGSAAVTTAVPDITTAVTTTVTEPSVTTTVTTIVTKPPVTTVTTVTEAPAKTDPPQENVDLETVEKESIDLLNNYRKGKSLKQLTISAGMCKAADEIAKELSVAFDINRVGAASGIRSRIQANGVSVSSLSYAYFATETTASEVLNDTLKFKDSSFDNASYDKIGIGHYYDPNSQYKDYWIVIVGK